MKALSYTLLLWVALLFCGCRSTHKITEQHTLATDSVVYLQRHQCQVSAIDSVWQHTELAFDSCFVFFEGEAETSYLKNHVAQPKVVSRPRAQSVRIYGAHLVRSSKECAITETREEDSLALALQSSLQQVLRENKKVRPSNTSIKLCLTWVFLAALLALLYWHRRNSDVS